MIVHYENMPVQDIEIFRVVKNENFQEKILIFFYFYSKHIYCGYSLEPSRSNEYPQSMFWSKNKKNRYTLHIPVFLYKSGGIRGYL